MSNGPTPLSKLWWEAVRPKTLPASVVPVLVGTAAAGQVVAWRFAAAMVVGLSLQIGVNFANDYFDAKKGVDAAREGPRRLVAAGLISERAMLAGTALAFSIGAAAGMTLAVAVGPELLVVGAVAIAAALGYSGGPRPYGALGLAEVSVFVFFGPVATVGSFYVQTSTITVLAMGASVPVGLLAAAILVANNLRDIETDARAGKRTLAVRLGSARTRILFSLLITGAFLTLGGYWIAVSSPRIPLSLASAPLALRALRLIRSNDNATLVRALVACARLELVFGILFSVDLWLA